MHRAAQAAVSAGNAGTGQGLTDMQIFEEFARTDSWLNTVRHFALRRPLGSQEAFEVWVNETNPKRYRPYSLTKGNCGWYLSELTHAAWDVWQSQAGGKQPSLIVTAPGRRNEAFEEEWAKTITDGAEVKNLCCYFWMKAMEAAPAVDEPVPTNPNVMPMQEGHLNTMNFIADASNAATGEPVAEYTKEWGVRWLAMQPYELPTNGELVDANGTAYYRVTSPAGMVCLRSERAMTPGTRLYLRRPTAAQASNAATGQGLTDEQIDRIHDAAAEALAESHGYHVQDARLDTRAVPTWRHAFARALLAAPAAPAPNVELLDALICLHAVARVDRDKQCSAVTNAAAVIHRYESLAVTPAATASEAGSADRAMLDWLTERLVDTIYLDDGTIIDVGTGRIGTRDAKVAPHDLRAAIRAAMTDQAQTGGKS